MLAATKGIARVGMRTAADRLLAVAGSKAVKYRVDLTKTKRRIPSGPTRLKARFEGKKGYAYITAGAETPELSWMMAPGTWILPGLSTLLTYA